MNAMLPGTGFYGESATSGEKRRIPTSIRGVTIGGTPPHDDLDKAIKTAGARIE